MLKSKVAIKPPYQNIKNKKNQKKHNSDFLI
jgi:hypothetical protein